MQIINFVVSLSLSLNCFSQNSQNDTLFLVLETNQVMCYKSSLLNRSIFIDLNDSTYLFEYKNVPLKYALLSTGKWYSQDNKICLLNDKNVFLAKYIQKYDNYNKHYIYKELPRNCVFKEGELIIDTLNLAVDDFLKILDLEDTVLAQMGVLLDYQSLYKNKKSVQVDFECQGMISAFLPGVVIEIGTSDIMQIKILHGESISNYSNLNEVFVHVGDYLKLGDIIGECNERTELSIAGISVTSK
jgi:hypothetical protein